MSKFEEMSFDGKCDVCGKETKVVACASLSMGAISYKYCEECLQKELLGKTVEEFIIEYNKINEEKYRWYKGYGRICKFLCNIILNISIIWEYSPMVRASVL